MTPDIQKGASHTKGCQPYKSMLAKWALHWPVSGMKINHAGMIVEWRCMQSAASVGCTHGNRYFQRGMAVDIWHTHSHQLIPKSVNTQHQPYFQLYNVHLLLAACQNCLQLANLIEPQNPTIADHFCSTFMQNTKNNVTERPKKFF